MDSVKTISTLQFRELKVVGDKEIQIQKKLPNNHAIHTGITQNGQENLFLQMM